MNTRRISSVVFVAIVVTLFVACNRAAPEDEKTIPTEVAVRVATVSRVTLHARVEAYGAVEAEPAGGGVPAGAARLAAPAPGIIRAVPVKEGQLIESGTIVVMLDDRVAQAQLDKALHALEFAEQRVAREKELVVIEGTSQKAIQEAAQQLASARADVAAAQGQLALVQLASPIAGIIAAVHVQPGQAVEPNSVVAEVVDLNRLVMTVRIPTRESAAVKVGQVTELLDDVSATAARGQVLFVSPQVDIQTATVLVRISVPPSASLRIGQFAHVRIVTEERSNRLAVPYEAIYTNHDGLSTLSVVHGDVAKRMSVTIGLRDGNLVEVEGEGLLEGATVVTIGSYALPAETKVRVLAEMKKPDAR